MSFLTPLFLLGIGAIAVPILVHLIQRERKHVVHFPSLMFVQKIPYQSVRRRRIRHWFLLLMRAVAILLIAAAFARPFLPRSAAAAVAAIGGNRELVVLLDRSASMGYEDRWTRAQAAARDAIGSIGLNDKATLILFDKNTEEAVRATSDRGRLESAVNTAKPTAASTRFGPALKLAESILSRSTLQRREAVLISDFQKTGWTGAEDIHFNESMRLTPVSVAGQKLANVSVPSVTFARAPFSGQERITVTAGVGNRGDAMVTGVPVTLEIGGHQLESQTISIGANASTSVAFAPFPLTEPSVHGIVKAGTDALPADNAFHFVLAPSQALSVLLIDNGSAESTLFLRKALSIGTAPVFQVETVPAARVSPATLDRRAVVILNDAMLPPGLAGGELKKFVERGGGLLVVFGNSSSWPSSEVDLLPGKAGGTVEPSNARGGTIVIRDYSHKVFDVFKAPRSGDFTAARVRRYRALEKGPDDRVLAVYDDGAIAAAERRVGEGRVIAWTTTFDDSGWNDLAKKTVFLPLVHQLMKYLGHYEEPTAWRTVGDVVDLPSLLRGKSDRVVVTPSTERRTFRAADNLPLELMEQGVYEVRSANNASGRPDRLAVNIDPAESDLAPMDSQELVAAVTGLANPNAGPPPQLAAELTAAEAERRQMLWWYLLFIGLLLLAAEVAVSNVLSRTERFT
jgi:hypothetical protein